MKRLWLAVFVVFVCCPVFAQDVPKAEVFAGGSYFRAQEAETNLFGWDFSVVGNLKRWFGIAADVSGVYGSVEVFRLGDVDTNLHTISVGPQFSFRGDGNTKGFVRVLAGLARAGGSAEVFGTRIGGSETDSFPHFSSLPESDCRCQYPILFKDIKLVNSNLAGHGLGVYPNNQPTLASYASVPVETEFRPKFRTGLLPIYYLLLFLGSELNL